MIYLAKYVLYPILIIGVVFTIGDAIFGDAELLKLIIKDYMEMR